MVSAEVKRVCQQVVNVWESGSVEGDYGLVVVYPDGPGGTRQVTYGRSQTTESGHLKELIQDYVEAPDAMTLYAVRLRGYLKLLGKVSLAKDREFIDLLEEAGGDPVMRRVQDEFFDSRYWEPAEAWAKANGFTEPLSHLVIYDSFVHSGSILGFLRNSFAEKVPARGGDEQKWIRAYVEARDAWLRRKGGLLAKTRYRTQCMLGEIARVNWSLTLPIRTQGERVEGVKG